MNGKSKSHIYTTVLVGALAAIIFVVTYFIKIPIPTPAGTTMLKVSNMICLMGGIVFGGFYGGLAAGIGSMLFDLLDPMFVASAPFTLVFFFLMAFVCGTIANAGGAKANSTGRNVLACIAGAGTYYVLNIGNSLIVMVLAGSGVWPAVVANSAKMITSGINAVIAVIGAVLLAKPVLFALRRAGVLTKMGR